MLMNRGSKLGLHVGGVTEDDVSEVVWYVNELRHEVLHWLDEHPDGQYCIDRQAPRCYLTHI
jgi:hypothetical protein